MSEYKNESTGLVTYSKAYFILGGKYQELKARNQTDNMASFVNQVEAAFSQGDINAKEKESLLNLVSNGATEHSDEYNRLYNTIQLMVSTGQNSEDRNEIKEEILLADAHELLLDGEVNVLLDMLNEKHTAAPKVTSFIAATQKAPAANTVPMRRKAANRKKTHTEGYQELEQEYRKLFTASGMKNPDASTRKFFRRVAQYYQEGRITTKEYQSFHAALDDQTAYLDRIEIDTSSDAYNKFKGLFLDLLSSDGEVIEVIKQVASWAVKNGTAQSAVVSNIIAVATSNLPVFLNSGNMLITVSNRERKVIPIREMQLS